MFSLHITYWHCGLLKPLYTSVIHKKIKIKLIFRIDHERVITKIPIINTLYLLCSSILFYFKFIQHHRYHNNFVYVIFKNISFPQMTTAIYYTLLLMKKNTFFFGNFNTLTLIYSLKYYTSN